MAYFPFFQDLQDQKGLMIGAGKVALHKARIILEYGARLCVVAPEIDPEFRKMKGVILRQRTFIPEDLCEVNFVICATDDSEINRQVAGMCRERGVLVNSVDDRENCSFFFPALIHRGMLTIGICTGGASPSAASALKKNIEHSLPADVEDILNYLNRIRPKIKKEFSQQQTRAVIFQKIWEACLEYGRALTEEEEQEIMDEQRRE